MNAPIAPVLSRIASIQSRFGGQGTGPRAAPGGASSSDFAAAYRAATAQVDSGTPAPPTTTSWPVPTTTGVATTGATRVAGSLATGGGWSTTAAPSWATRTGPAGSTGSIGAAGQVPTTLPYAAEFDAAGARHGVPSEILAAVGWVESRYQPEVVSPAGAIGLMQLMPVVADELGVDATDPVQAIDGASRLLRSHYERFGSWELAIAAYFAGAGAVSRAGDAIPSPNAREYVQKVMERMTTT